MSNENKQAIRKTAADQAQHILKDAGLTGAYVVDNLSLFSACMAAAEGDAASAARVYERITLPLEWAKLGLKKKQNVRPEIRPEPTKPGHFQY